MRSKSYALMIIGIILGMWAAVYAAPPSGKGRVRDNSETQGRIIVKYREGTGEGERAWVRGRAAALSHKKLHNLGMEVLSIPPGLDMEAIVDELNRDPSVQFAEPDAKIQWLGMPRTVPDDPGFASQWYLDAQPLQGYVGTSSNTVLIDFDIDAPEGWAVLASAYAGSHKGAVGVLDSGCGELGYFDDTTGYVPNHQDLPNASLFANTAEKSALPVRGADDDGNDYVDDVNGWDFWMMDAEPRDDILSTIAPYHGTAISGIVGAAWGGTGMAGIGRGGIVVLPLRGGDPSDYVQGIDYAIGLASAGAPVKVLNVSWRTTTSFGMGLDLRSVRTAVSKANEAGIAVVAAAGNESGSNDDYFNRTFPAEYTRIPLSNVLAVAAASDYFTSLGTDYPGGYLADFSNYGPGSVQIAAPGVNIYTAADGTSGYSSVRGTSFSAPIAAAVLAHVMAVHPGMAPAEAIDRVIDGGDFDARLAGLIQSGKRVNLAGALAPFHPYSGLAYLDTLAPISMYADTVSALYGTIASARLNTSLSTVNTAAVMASSAGAWAVSPTRPGIASFVFSFGGSAPVGSYETGPWRVTAIRPFTAQLGVGDTLDFQSLMPASAGTVTWSLLGAYPPEVATIDAQSGVFTADTPGRVRVTLEVNGEPVDNSGWILVVPELPTSSGGGGGGCFVATASWGRQDAPQVEALRTFRDRALLTNAVGRRIVDLYYRHSPPVAAWLDRNPAAKPLVRAALGPVALMAWLLTSMWGVALASVGTAGWLLSKGIGGKGKRESRI